MMRDNVGAAYYANLVINTGRYPLVSTETALRAMWRNDNSTEDIFLLDVTASSFGTSAVGAGANFNDPGTTSSWSANHGTNGGMGIFARSMRRQMVIIRILFLHKPFLICTVQMIYA